MWWLRGRREEAGSLTPGESQPRLDGCRRHRHSGLGFLEADTEMRFLCGGLLGATGRHGSCKGVRKAADGGPCAATTEAPACPPRSSGAGRALRSWPKLRQRSRALSLPSDRSLNTGYPREGAQSCKVDSGGMSVPVLKGVWVVPPASTSGSFIRLPRGALLTPV